MEIEFNWRFVLIATFLALIGVAVFLVSPWLGHHTATTDIPAKTPVAEHQKIVAGSVDISFENSSNWKISGVESCLPKLSAWLEKYPIESLSIIVVNEPTDDMRMTFEQTGTGSPSATVEGVCTETKENSFQCELAILGDIGANLDVATTMATAWMIREFYRPKTKENASETNVEGMNAFIPLINKESNQWKSNCLYITQ